MYIFYKLVYVLLNSLLRVREVMEVVNLRKGLCWQYISLFGSPYSGLKVVME